MKFDRESAVRNWRLSILSRGGLRVSEVDELEDHLEHIEAELLEQLPADEAFWVAAHRVGTPDALTREFGKVRPNFGWATRAQWAVLGLLTYRLLQPLMLSLILVFAGGLKRVPPFAGLGEFVWAMGSPLSVIAIIATVLLAVHWIRPAPNKLERLFRWAAGASRKAIAAAALGVAVLYFGVSLLSSQLILWGDMGSISDAQQLQFAWWFIVPVLLNFAVPALLFLLVVRLQRGIGDQAPSGDA